VPVSHPQPDRGLPLVPRHFHAPPPDLLIGSGGHVARAERAVARGMPLPGDGGCHRRQRSRCRHALVGAEGATNSPCSVDDLRRPLVVRPAPTPPPNLLGRTSRHVGRSQIAVLRPVPFAYESREIRYGLHCRARMRTFLLHPSVLSTDDEDGTYQRGADVLVPSRA
jgi:hypothetical protein